VHHIAIKVLSAKKQNPNADTSELERKVDQLVYKLYDLTEEEIKIIEDCFLFLQMSMFPQISLPGYLFKFMTRLGWINTDFHKIFKRYNKSLKKG